MAPVTLSSHILAPAAGVWGEGRSVFKPLIWKRFTNKRGSLSSEYEASIAHVCSSLRILPESEQFELFRIKTNNRALLQMDAKAPKWPLESCSRLSTNTLPTSSPTTVTGRNWTGIYALTDELAQNEALLYLLGCLVWKASLRKITTSFRFLTYPYSLGLP